MYTKFLYGKDKKGGYKVWSIEVCGNEIIILHGKEGGKQTEKRERIAGKNIGKANETSPEQQAGIEAIARAKKQMDRGYRENKGALEELPLLPMLAHDYLKQGHRMKFPCIGSPKMDGVRCLAIRYSDRVQLKSRGGKEYSVEHIQKQLMDLMVPGEIFDGELYIHGKYLEEIVSAVKKPNEDTPELHYVIFDYVSKAPYHARYLSMMDRLFEVSQQQGTHVGLLSAKILHTKEGLLDYHKQCVASGFEGIMMRNMEGLYESGKRSADLQKYKEFLDDEFEIMDIIEDRNGNAVFVVWDAVADSIFNVTYGNFEQRKHQLANKELYTGKYLNVKFQTRYKDSLLPQFPTGQYIRDCDTMGNPLE